jgi:selenocysteine-specific elongation factor
LVESIQPRRLDGVFRLPLERGFSISGYGTVVSGIPVAGMAKTGDEVVLLPENVTGRIRRVEVYGQTSDSVKAGQCAALNVGHWDHHAIHRGDTLTIPGYFSPQQWFVCSLRLLPREKLVLKSGAEVKFHTGTAEVAAMFYPLKGHEMRAGDCPDFCSTKMGLSPSGTLVQIKAKTPIVAGPADHFLLRTASPVRTIGGGLIVEAVEERIKARAPEAYQDLLDRAEAVLDERRFVEYCIRRAESLAATEGAIAFRCKIPRDRLQGILAELVERQLIFPVAARGYVHRDTAAETGQKILEQVGEFHKQSPESPGFLSEEMRQTMSIDKAVFDAIVARLKSDGRIVEKCQRLALPTHRSTFRDEDSRLLEGVEALFRDQAFRPPSAAEVSEQTGIEPNKVEKLLGMLRDHERLVQVEEGMHFHCDAVARAKELLAEHFHKNGKLESVDFKYLLNTTRKFALPMLDYLDKIGLTRRVGNTRFPKGGK